MTGTPAGAGTAARGESRSRSRRPRPHTCMLGFIICAMDDALDAMPADAVMLVVQALPTRAVCALAVACRSLHSMLASELVRRAQSADAAADADSAVRRRAALLPAEYEAAARTLDARHHARHPGMRQQVAAGGAALRTVGTGFERDIGGRPSRSVASLRQSCGLGMRTSASCGPAASDDDFVADQNAGDTGVRVAGRTRARA